MRISTAIFCLGLILFFGVIPSLFSAENNVMVHVAPGGNDSNPGTRDKPFATIQKAIDTLAYKEQEQKIIFVEQGTYFLTEPIRLKDSIRFIGQPRNMLNQSDVIISGGRKITGFKKVETGLVVAEIPEVKNGSWDFRDLYVNDKRAIRAREPNNDYFRIEKSGEDRRTNFIYNEGDLKNWKDLENVELTFLHDWSITRCPIKSIDESERRLTVPHRIGCDLDFFKIDGWEPNPRYFVENSIEFLDAPGEWFLDKKAGKLFYRLKEGESAESLEVIAPVLTQLFIVEGTPDKKINGVIANVRFSHAAYFPKPADTVWEMQAAAYSSPGKSGDAILFPPSAGAVHLEFADNFNFDHCRFDHLGENGLWFSKGCSNCTVIGSQFIDIGANGIMIGTYRHENTAKNCSVTQSLVEQVGQTLFGSVGIWIGLTEQTVVSYSTIRNLPYSGISCGWQWNPEPTPAKRNSIIYNEIFDCMQTLSDGGGIYTLGFQPESLLAGNEIRGIPQAAGRAESNGMFLDEGSSGFTITNNVICETEQSSLRFNKAGKNTVMNNVLSNKEGVPMVRYDSMPEENIELIDNRNLQPNSKEFLDILETLKKRAANRE